MYNANSTGNVVCNRMPYNLTTSGFSHSKSSGSTLIVSYMSTGKKI